MIKEIKRNNWSKFVKSFSQKNRYRPVTVSSNEKIAVNDSCNDALLGLQLEKNGRFIDGIRLCVGKYDPNDIIHPVISVKNPAKVELEKDDDGNDLRLIVNSKDGVTATVALGENQGGQTPEHFVSKIAYSLYEQRGGNHGDDWSDWLTAEAKLRRAENQFTQ